MNFFKLISVFILLISYHSCFGQSTLYLENFSTNTGKGHNGTSVDTTGVGSSWTIDPTNFVTPASSDYFKVLGGVFESFNTDATQSLPMYWYSKTVSISGYSNVTLSIDLTQINSNSSSGIEAFYSIDGGAYVSFGSLISSTLSGTNVNGSTVSVSGLLGSTIRIRVNHWGTSSTPYYRHDNVSIIGYIPVNYYSKSSGNLNELSNWGTNADGTGTVPSNFTTAAQTFHIRNNSSPTIGAAWTVSGTSSKIIVGDGTNSCDFTIPAAYAVSGTIDVSNNGTLSIAHLTTNPTLGSLASGSTVDYKGAGAQTIANASYHHLKLSTSGAKTLIAGVTSIAGNLTTSGTATTATVVGLIIGGNLNIGDGTTFTNAGHSLTVTGTTTIGGGTSGTLTVPKTFTGLVTLSSGATWNNSGNSPITFKGGITKLGVSTFTSGSAAQTFSTNNQTLAGALTISSLTITSITLTASNNLTVSTLTTDASAVLDMGTSSTFTVTTASANSGKVKTSVLTSTSSTPLTTGISWGGTVEYAALIGSQTVMAGTYTNLTNLNTSGTNTASGAIVVNGTLTTSAGGTFDMGANALSGTVTPENSGTIRTSNTSATPITTGKSWGGTIEYAATTGGQKVMAGTYNNLTLLNTSGSNTTSPATVTVNGTFTTTSGGTFAPGYAVVLNGTTACSQGTMGATAATVTYGNASGGQNIIAGTYYNITFSNGSGTNTACGNIVLNAAGVITTTAGGTFDLSTYTLTGGSTNITSGIGKIKTSNTGGTPLPSGITWTGTVEYASASSQTLMQGTYNNLIISGGGEKTLSGNVTIGASGVLTLTSGLVTPSASTLTIDNLAVGAISGGSTTSFVNGAIKWKINTAVGSFVFPVGASGNYYPFTLTNPTRSASSQYITVSASASNPNGSNGPTCVSSISSSEYWTVALTTANLSGATISLGRTTALGSLIGIGQASTSNGAYASLAGIVSGTNINTSNTITTIASSGTNYFAMVQVSSTAPTITTPTSASVSTTTVTLGGNITSLNCSNIIERGIYYSTTNGFTDGTGTKNSVSSGPYSTGVFTIPVAGLVPNTVYYYKAFATNSSGSSYTTQGTFTTNTQTFPIQEGYNTNATFPTTNGSSTLGGWEINTGTGGTCNASRSQLPVNSSNAWLFTPPFYATSGKIYTLSYLSKYSELADVSIYLTDAQDSSAVISSNLFNSVSDNGSSFINATADEWLCQTSGVYYFAFKVSTVGFTCQLDCISIAETAPVTITWDGSSSTDWLTAANWDLNRIPNSSDIIIVPSGLSNYPLSVPNGSFNSLSLTRGSSGTTTIGTTTFSGNVTLNSSFASNTITFNGTTSIGGNLAVGTSGNNFNFTVNGATNVNGTFTLGAVNTAVATTVNNPITVVGAFTMGNNSNHATTISYSNSTTKAITASNSGNLVFYGTVNYTASSGDQIVMKSQYNGALNASGGAKRFMEGNLDINSSLTLSGGNWYCGAPETVVLGNGAGSDANLKDEYSPFQGDHKSARWQMFIKASEMSTMSVNDIISSFSVYVATKRSTSAFQSFTVKLGHTSSTKFSNSSPSFFLNDATTTVYGPVAYTTASGWNTFYFDTPFTWNGSSNVLVEISFYNTVPNATSGGIDAISYTVGTYGDDALIRSEGNTSQISATDGIDADSRPYSIFNIANGPFNINITNNWLNSGANFYHLQNTVTFDGNSNQQVTTRGDNYFNYVVNNTYNDGFSLTLNDDCEVENNATFQDGVIQTGSNKLVLMSSDASKLLAYSNAGYVKGTLRRFFANNTSTYAFPLGKGYSTSTYFLSDVINSNLVGVNYLDGKFIDGFPTGYSQSTFQALGKQLSGSGVITRDIKRLDQAGYTQLDPNQQPTSGAYSLKMYAQNYTLGDWIDNHQCIMKRPTGSNSLNDFNMAGTINADDGLGRMVSQNYLLSNNLTSFSEFAAGLGNPVALPIQLLYFGVKRKNTHARLEWKTGTEQNNDYFSIERSKDGINFKQIGKVKGSGTSSHEKNYLFIDSFPLSGLSYYRLKQVDYDANFEYSPIKAINFDFAAQNDFIIYPNPLENNELEFIYSSDNEGTTLMQIIEPIGRVIHSKKEIVNEGRNYFKINLKDFPRGSYLLLIQDELGNQIHRKFVH